MVIVRTVILVFSVIFTEGRTGQYDLRSIDSKKPRVMLRINYGIDEVDNFNKQSVKNIGSYFNRAVSIEGFLTLGNP